MFCSKCGNELQKGILCCDKCGNKVDTNEKLAKEAITNQLNRTTKKYDIKRIIFFSILAIIVISILCVSLTMMGHDKRFDDELQRARELTKESMDE